MKFLYSILILAVVGCVRTPEPTKTILLHDTVTAIDTVYIHDTVVVKRYINDKVRSYNQTGGQTAETIIINR